MASAPRIILKNVVLHGFHTGNLKLRSMHVPVSSGVLQPLPSTNGNVANSHLFGAETAAVSVRNLLISALDDMPLGCPEADILSETTEIPEGYYRDLLRTALKELDPACFGPEMNDHHSDIVLAKSLLRNASLHVCKAILQEFKREPYRCTDSTCWPLRTDLDDRIPDCREDDCCGCYNRRHYGQRGHGKQPSDSSTAKTAKAVKRSAETSKHFFEEMQVCIHGEDTRLGVCAAIICDLG